MLSPNRLSTPMPPILGEDDSNLGTPQTPAASRCTIMANHRTSGMPFCAAATDGLAHSAAWSDTRGVNKLVNPLMRHA